MDVREKLVELFYDNNVRCDQKIEGLADDVMDIIANGVTIPEWIPVTERLPEMHKVVYEDRLEPSGQGSYLISHTVLVYSDDGTIGTGTYEEGVTIVWNADTWNDNVTHWMPLPPAPKGE